MGKSPGRWIKTVLFGKKHSKSGLWKNAKHGKKDAAKTQSEDLSGNPLIISNPRVVTDDGEENLELENSISGISCDTAASIPVNQVMESQSVSVSLPINDAEMRIQGQSAAKVQAAFRGYLARRAFWALKGIIRLQALIRGHLVRRQAVATLRCMQAVVKFQAVARGRRVRVSGTWAGIHRKCNIGALKDAKQADLAKLPFMSERQAANAYICKLLLLLPVVMPLSLQYDPAEPNSSWNWLERWSISCFWEPPPRPRKVSNVKPQRKLGGSQTVDNELMKSKRTIRKASVSGNGDIGALASFETEKPKRNPRKATAHLTELVQQEQTQNELERVKRNLRKVSVSATPPSEKSEMETEKPQQQSGPKAPMNSTPPNVSEKEIVISTENPIYSDVVEKQALVEAPSKTLTMEESVEVPHDNHPLVESHSLENGTRTETTLMNEEMGSREDESGKDNLKVRKRRSFPAKQEYAENISQNTPTLPSYMAATESAKAKLRAQGSARFIEDGAEQGDVRRHSLPASTNGKLSSVSPRMQKPVLANGKGSSKTNRSVPSSRDDKVLQPGWRR